MPIACTPSSLNYFQSSYIFAISLQCLSYSRDFSRHIYFRIASWYYIVVFPRNTQFDKVLLMLLFPNIQVTEFSYFIPLHVQVRLGPMTKRKKYKACNAKFGNM